MEENPYQPPLIDAPTLAVEQRSPYAPRPLGIWILSGVHLVAGLFLVVATYFLVKLFATGGENVTNLPFWFIVPLMAGIALVALSSSVGLWHGAKWGWWLATFYYVWATLGALAEIPFELWYMEQWNVESIAPMLLKKLFKTGFHVLLVLYFFKGTVREFFELNSLRVIPTLAVLSAISLALLNATMAVAMLQSDDDF